MSEPKKRKVEEEEEIPKLPKSIDAAKISAIEKFIKEWGHIPLVILDIFLRLSYGDIRGLCAASKILDKYCEDNLDSNFWISMIRADILEYTNLSVLQEKEYLNKLKTYFSNSEEYKEAQLEKRESYHLLYKFALHQYSLKLNKNYGKELNESKSKDPWHTLYCCFLDEGEMDIREEYGIDWWDKDEQKALILGWKKGFYYRDLNVNYNEPKPGTMAYPMTASIFTVKGINNSHPIFPLETLDDFGMKSKVIFEKTGKIIPSPDEYEFINFDIYEEIFDANFIVYFKPYYLAPTFRIEQSILEVFLPQSILKALKLPSTIHDIERQFEKIIDYPPATFSENLVFGVQSYAKARLIIFLVPRDKGNIHQGLMHVPRSDVHILYDQMIDMSDLKDRYTFYRRKKIYPMKNMAPRFKNIAPRFDEFTLIQSIIPNTAIDLSPKGNSFGTSIANISIQFYLKNHL